MSDSVMTMPTDILVRVQATPNPNAMKFVVNVPVKKEGKATFTRPSEAAGNSFWRTRLRLGVRQPHFFENVVTVIYAMEKDLILCALKSRQFCSLARRYMIRASLLKRSA